MAQADEAQFIGLTQKHKSHNAFVPQIAEVVWFGIDAESFVHIKVYIHTIREIRLRIKSAGYLTKCTFFSKSLV